MIQSCGVGDLGNDTRRPRVLVEQRADEHDRPISSVATLRGDRHGLPLLDHGQIGGAHGEIDPDPFEIDDHKKFGLEIVASDQRSDIDPAFRHPTRHGRANLLTAQ
jgi:hypothetical protein